MQDNETEADRKSRGFLYATPNGTDGGIDPCFDRCGIPYSGHIPPLKIFQQEARKSAKASQEATKQLPLTLEQRQKRKREILLKDPTAVFGLLA